MVKTHLYRHFDSSENLLYVGISLSAVNRLAQHKNFSHWFEDLSKVTIETFRSREEAILAERKAVENEKPKYNIKYNKRLRTLPEIQLGAEETTYFEKAKTEIEYRVVVLQPIYSLKEARDLLQLSPAEIDYVLDTNQLGHVVLRLDEVKNNRGGSSIRKVVKITGWQMLDFIEALGRNEITTSLHMPPKRKTQILSQVTNI